MSRDRNAPTILADAPPSLDLRPIRVEKTFASVCAEIKRLIFSGALKPGDRLPSELELVEKLGVSRPSVREALRVLELSGFLQVQRGGAGGRIIVDTIAASIGNSLADAVQLGNITTEELTTARIELETVIVRHAVARAEEPELRALRENIVAAYEKIAAGVWAADDNIKFHKLLAKAAKNQVLSLLLEALMLMLCASMPGLGMVPSTEKSREFTRAHEGILDAVVARDTDRAVERMREHLLSVTARLQEPNED
ncbi:MAG: FadR family transcriptional regulator [Deltaproteobacteria bacterium]|nr:FadR family transcriptional regulator [Deltaproteobacteria bacterium]